MLFDYPLLMLATDDDEVIHVYRREGTVIGTNVLFIKIPAIVRFFAMLGMLIFPLHRIYLEDMSKKLREIHEEKRRAFSQS